MTLIEKPMMFEMGNVLATIYTKLYKEFNDRAAAVHNDSSGGSAGGDRSEVEPVISISHLKRILTMSTSGGRCPREAITFYLAVAKNWAKEGLS